MRKPLIAANWKMHKSLGEAEAFMDEFIPMISGVDDVDVVIAPVYTALDRVRAKLGTSGIGLSAQNVYFEKSGAFTGEISAEMLRDAGCEYAIIGHSERRQFFGDTDESVNRKVRAALEAGLKVIFCIGESLKQREAERTNDVITGQLKGGLKEIDLTDVVIAYEPIWAIGTGVTATPEQAQEAHHFIRGQIANMYDDTTAASTRILYGGSVKPENVKTLMDCPDIDGALVGGASLKPDSFAMLVRFKEQ